MIVPGLNTLPIFPCKLSKSPLTPNGFYNAVVGADYSHWPRVGVATGAVSGIDVIDIDPDGLPWLEANRPRLPPTREHQTSRGVHLLLKHHPGMRNSNRRIAPGVDVRATRYQNRIAKPRNLSRSCRSTRTGNGFQERAV